MNNNSRPGFSLIEIMIAITIMGIIAAGSIYMFTGYIDSARKETTKSMLQSAQTGIERFYMEVGDYPETLTDLLRKPSDAKLSKKWAGPYWPKKDEPADAYGRTLVYKKIKGGVHPYELYSWGKGGEGSPSEEHIDIWELE